MAPENVRGEFLGSMLDFEPDEMFENWLEAHEVAVNSNWLVTRASRMRLLGNIFIISLYCDANSRKYTRKALWGKKGRNLRALTAYGLSQFMNT